ncbi:MAG: RNA polymerase sigma factor [Parvularculaceae bacterium]
MALSDIDLVMLAKASQDETAFAELVRRHQAGLRAFLRRLGPNDGHADDIAQEAFLKAHGRLSGFQGGASFRSWLYAIAWREFLQAKRKAGARGRAAAAFAAEPRDGKDVRDLSADLSLDLKRALGRLDESERAAILLCDAAGLSHGEAAAALGAPLGTVKSQIARAREKLRAALEGRISSPNAHASSQPNGAAHAC